MVRVGVDRMTVVAAAVAKRVVSIGIQVRARQNKLG